MSENIQPDEQPFRPVPVPASQPQRPGRGIQEGKPPRIGRGHDKARLTVVEYIYHHPPFGSPDQATLTYARWLDSTEQPFIRQMTVGEEWRSVEAGWLSPPSLTEDASSSLGMLIVYNNIEIFRHVIPTPEEREEAASRVLVFGLKVGEVEEVILLCRVLPGESLRVPLPSAGLFADGDKARLMVRCENGEASYTLRIYPA